MAGILRAAFLLSTCCNLVAAQVEASSLMSKPSVVGANEIYVTNNPGFKNLRKIVIGNPADAATVEEREITNVAYVGGRHILKLSATLGKAHAVGTTVMMPGKNDPHKCKLSKPPNCQFPFTYKGLTYNTCTGVDVVQKMWCSLDKTYAGHWAECKDSCKGQWPVKKIVSTVVAGSVAATGIGLAAAAIAHQAQGGSFDPFKGIHGLKPVGQEHPKAKAAKAAAVNGKPFVIKQATPGHPGMMGEWVAPGQGTPARLLTGVEGPATVATDSAQLGLVVAVAFIVLIFGFICSFAAPRLNRKRTHRVAPAEPYLQA